MKYLNTTDCSLFFAERSKFMTKYALIGLLAVCATVLCFSLIFRERLCELNIHRGKYSGAGNSGPKHGSKLPGGDGSPRFPEV